MRRIPNEKLENNELQSTVCTEGLFLDGNFSDGKDSETYSGCSHPSSPLRTPEPSTPPSFYSISESKNHSFEDTKDFDESIASILLALRDNKDFVPRLCPSKLPQHISVHTGIREPLEAGSESDAIINGRDSSDSEYDWDGDGKIVDRNGKLKAPSGFACDKHKRWKKRCPSHCPMRKPSSIHNNVESRENSRIQSNIRNTTQSSDTIPRETTSDITMEEISVTPKLRKRSAPESSNSSDQKITAANTISCQFHAQLHARCPLNCPDRRIKTSSRKRQKLNNVDE